MDFDPNNNIVQLCAHGMELEGMGQLAKAAGIFNEAWDQASNDFEKCIAAHYLARHQETASGKLKWDQLALHHALNTNDQSIKPTLASLYLNIGKCYEDLHDPENAKKHYQLAVSYTAFLPHDGYGAMIKRGIESALTRMNVRLPQ